LRDVVIDPARGLTIEEICARPENRGPAGLFHVTEVIWRARERRAELVRQLQQFDVLERAFGAAAVA
jgi:hypothetical protein